MRDRLTSQERRDYNAIIHSDMMYDAARVNLRPDGMGRWPDERTTRAVARLISLGRDAAVGMASEMGSDRFDTMISAPYEELVVPATPTRMGAGVYIRMRRCIIGDVPPDVDDDDVLTHLFGMPDLGIGHLELVAESAASPNGGAHRIYPRGRVMRCSVPTMIRLAHDGVSAADAGAMNHMSPDMRTPMGTTMWDEGVDAMDVFALCRPLGHVPEDDSERILDIRAGVDLGTGRSPSSVGDYVDAAFQPRVVRHWRHGDTVALRRLIGLLARGSHPDAVNPGEASAAMTAAYARGISSGIGFGRVFERMLNAIALTGSDSDLLFLFGFEMMLSRIIESHIPRTGNPPTGGAVVGRIRAGLDANPDIMGYVSAGMPADFIEQTALSVAAS